MGKLLHCIGSRLVPKSSFWPSQFSNLDFNSAVVTRTSFFREFKNTAGKDSISPATAK
jgi:hypothetical protein